MKKLLALFLVASYLLTAVPVSAAVQLNPDGTVKATTTKKKTTTPKKKATTKKTTKKPATKKPATKKPTVKKTPAKKSAAKKTTKKKTTVKKPAKPKKTAAKSEVKTDQQNLTTPDTEATSAVLTPDPNTEAKPVYDNGEVSAPQPENPKTPAAAKQFTFAGLGAGGALAVFALIKKFFLH